MSTRITYSLSTGARGPQGDAGEGVPIGGTTGQVLTKTSGTDYDTEWATASGGGAVTSVAGRTGAVTLSSADITDATDSATASKIVKRNGSGAASFASLTLGTHTITPIGTSGNVISIPEVSGTMWLGSMFSAFGLAWAQSTTFTAPSATGTLAVTGSAAGVPDALTNGTIAGTLNITAGTITVTNQSTFRDAIGLGAANSPTFAGISVGDITTTGRLIYASSGTAFLRCAGSNVAAVYNAGSLREIRLRGGGEGALSWAAGADPGGAVGSAITQVSAGLLAIGTGAAGSTAGSLSLTNLTASGYIAGSEITAPAAPAANGYRIFAEDNGAGKTRLMVQFATGAAQQIAIEP